MRSSRPNHAVLHAQEPGNNGLSPEPMVLMCAAAQGQGAKTFSEQLGATINEAPCHKSRDIPGARKMCFLVFSAGIPHGNGARSTLPLSACISVQRMAKLRAGGQTPGDKVACEHAQ